MSERLLCPKEIAARVNVSVATIYRLIQEGHLKALVIRGSYRIEAAELERYLGRKE